MIAVILMKKLLCVILALTVLALSGSCSLFPQPGTVNDSNAKLTVHFIDVGQGDSILLESDDEFVLIDAGERDYGEKVLNYIEDRGADELKYMVATHPHSDHIGGLRTVMDGVDVENFISADTDCETYTWLKLLRAVEKQKVNAIEAEAGSTYSFGSASFTILGPLYEYDENYNNDSIVTKVTCGSTSFLLMADAESESEYDMIDEGEDLRADVLKCGHHGSSSSTSDKLLKEVNPSFAVVSCGKNNDYGHPHRETVRKLQALGCPMLRTDEAGTIVAYTDGTTISFSAEKKDYSSYTYTVGDKKNSTAALNYVGNKNSKVFHYSDCGGVQTMSDSNKVTFSSREDAVKAGYTPCSTCKP